MQRFHRGHQVQHLVSRLLVRRDETCNRGLVNLQLCSWLCGWQTELAGTATGLSLGLETSAKVEQQRFLLQVTEIGEYWLGHACLAACASLPGTPTISEFNVTPISSNTWLTRSSVSSSSPSPCSTIAGCKGAESATGLLAVTMLRAHKSSSAAAAAAGQHKALQDETCCI